MKALTHNGKAIILPNGKWIEAPASSPTLITKTITENGTYNASGDNADGYSSVIANVPTGTTVQTATGTFTSRHTYITLESLDFLPDFLEIALPNGYYADITYSDVGSERYYPSVMFDMTNVEIGDYAQGKYAESSFSAAPVSDKTDYYDVTCYATLDSNGKTVIYIGAPVEFNDPYTWTAYNIGLREDD